jgi:hypothetical protein
MCRRCAEVCLKMLQALKKNETSYLHCIYIRRRASGAIEKGGFCVRVLIWYLKNEKVSILVCWRRGGAHDRRRFATRKRVKQLKCKKSCHEDERERLDRLEIHLKPREKRKPAT